MGPVHASNVMADYVEELHVMEDKVVDHNGTSQSMPTLLSNGDALVSELDHKIAKEHAQGQMVDHNEISQSMPTLLSDGDAKLDHKIAKELEFKETVI